ncbi:hypothetical protein ALC60_00543, partial [Trachymyrmex zeteki]
VRARLNFRRSFEDSSTSSSLRVPAVCPTPTSSSPSFRYEIVCISAVIPEMAETENSKCRKSGDSEIQGAVQLGHPRMRRSYLLFLPFSKDGTVGNSRIRKDAAS